MINIIFLFNSEAGLPASFCLEPISKPKKIQNIEAWQQAFLIFVGVYTPKYPHEPPAFMKYGQIICNLASHSRNWLFSDKHFRYLLQTRLASCHGVLFMGNCGSARNLLIGLRLQSLTRVIA